MLREHSAILSTFIMLPFVFKTSALSIFEWPLKTCFIVYSYFGFYSNIIFEYASSKRSGLEVIKHEYSLKLEIKRSAWLLADTWLLSASSQSLHFILSLRMNSSLITWRPGCHVGPLKTQSLMVALWVAKGPMFLEEN